MFLRVSAAIVVGTLSALMSAGAAGALPASAATQDVWHDIGRASSAIRVDVAVVMKYHHAAELDRLLDAQGDDASPLFHHYLTPLLFGQYFAPSVAEYSATLAQLRRAGFTIANTFANRTVIDAAAPAPVVERFFSTELHIVRRNDGIMRYVNVRPCAIPAVIATDVAAVVGLDSAHTLRPQYVRLPTRPRLASIETTGVDGKPLFGRDGGYGPQIYRRSYAFPPGLTGSGHTSGIVSDADFLDSDLAAYLRYFGVKRTGTTYRVYVDGGPPRRILTADSLETTLDSETLVSLAPGTTLYVYEAPAAATLVNFIDMYNTAVTDNKAETVNTSFSQCETLDSAFSSAAEAIEAQGSALGITFHSATGDVGSLTYGCGQNASVAVPAATPHNVAVGGTFEEVNHATGQETSETGWNDGSGITGGGVSTVFALPAYQEHITNILPSGRNIPDVSFDASAYTGESVFYDYNFNGPVGGTSISSPLFGAGLTTLNEMHGSRAGFFNPTLYKAWKKYGYSDGSNIFFRDMTSGSVPPMYYARRGYDQVSGIGAMLFANFGTLLPCAAGRSRPQTCE